MATINLPLPTIAGIVVTEITPETRSSTSKGEKIKGAVKLEQTVFACMSESAALAVVRNILPAQDVAEQAVLSLMARFWQDNAVPQGDDVRKLISGMMTDQLEPKVFGENCKSVRKPDVWRSMKSLVSRVLEQLSNHAALYAEHEDGSPDYDSILGQYALKSLLSKTSVADETRMATSLKSMADMDTAAIMANRDAVLGFVKQAASALGTSVADAIDHQIAPIERDTLVVLRNALDNETITPDQVLMLVTAWQDANTPKLQKVA
jgi:hypothetical protein